MLQRSPCSWIVIFLLALVCSASVPGAAQATRQSDVRNAANYPGTSIVERIQAAILDCGASPCEVYVPAGTYAASPVAGWHSRDSTGSRLGVILPSNVDLRGAGVGHTTIKVQRASGD